MAKAAETEETEAKPGNSLGMVGLILLGVSALIASFAVSYLSVKPAPQTAAVCTPEDTAHAAHTVPTPPSREDQRYVELEDILITIGSQPADRYLKMSAVIVTTSDTVSDVEKAQPLLADAFNYYLRSVEVSDFENPSFYPRMREQLGLRAEFVLGGDVARGVLITDFLLR